MPRKVKRRNTAEKAALPSPHLHQSHAAATPIVVPHLVVHLRAAEATAKGHTEFVVECAVGEGQWTVRRRFREFSALHEALLCTFPHLKLPSLPPKAWLGNTGAKWVEERREKLNEFVDALLRLDEVARDTTLTSFFEVPRQYLYAIAARADAEGEQQGRAFFPSDGTDTARKLDVSESKDVEEDAAQVSNMPYMYWSRWARWFGCAGGGGCGRRVWTGSRNRGTRSLRFTYRFRTYKMSYGTCFLSLRRTQRFQLESVRRHGTSTYLPEPGVHLPTPHAPPPSHALVT